ncbi:NADP-dependent glyceraldehyde-3-phosphate dehydrogenase, partial [Cucurbita argyrosperma subsp. sororia]
MVQSSDSSPNTQFCSDEFPWQVMEFLQRFSMVKCTNTIPKESGRKKSSSGKTVAIIPTTRKTKYRVQACNQEEVNKVMEIAKSAQESWAKTPLWRRAEVLHKAAAILKEHKAPIAECLVKEIAMPAKDAVTEVVRSGDLVSYCAEEGPNIALLPSGQRCTVESIADALVEKVKARVAKLSVGAPEDDSDIT